MVSTQVLAEGDRPVLAETVEARPTWTVGEVWTGVLQVPPGAGLFGQVLALPPAPEPTEATDPVEGITGVLASGAAQSPDWQFMVTLHLRGPDGFEHFATGPESDRQILSLAGPVAAGEWTYGAVLHAASYRGSPTQLPARGHLRLEAQGGLSLGAIADAALTVPGRLIGASERVVTLPANAEGGPPEVRLRARPYHDHDVWYQAEPSDLSSMEAVLAPASPRPPRTLAELDALWPDPAYLLHHVNAQKMEVYSTDGEGRITGYVTGEPYADHSPSRPVLLPGATRLSFEVTWTPATEIPDLEVRFKPGSRFDWKVPLLMHMEAGHATFEAPVDAAWWDDPEQEQGYWDLNVLRRLQPNEDYAYAFDYAVHAVAHRGQDAAPMHRR